MREGNADAAIAALREAVTIEDGLPYSEPPVWHHPPRQVLGAVLLEAGRPAEAEAVYREDLKRFRENGWSLFGLRQSLRAQHRGEEAARRAAPIRARVGAGGHPTDLVADHRRRGLVADHRTTSDTSGTSKLSTGVRMNYVERGDRRGTPVVLLHGYSDSWRSYDRVLPLLPSSLRVFAVTQRGHGDSGKPETGYAVARLRHGRGGLSRCDGPRLGDRGRPLDGFDRRAAVRHRLPRAHASAGARGRVRAAGQQRRTFATCGRRWPHSASRSIRRSSATSSKALSPGRCRRSSSRGIVTDSLKVPGTCVEGRARAASDDGLRVPPRRDGACRRW